MICVDTSVWVAALRQSASREARVLSDLLDSDQVVLPVLVRLEILSGAGRADRPRLRRLLSALPSLVPTRTTWRTAEQWIADAGDRGHRHALVDLLIAALSREAEARLWSKDADFGPMAARGWIELYAPPA